MEKSQNIMKLIVGAAPLSRLDFTQIYLRKVEIIAFCEKLLSRMDFL